MNPNEELVFSILYHPISYTHPSHLPQAWLPAKPDSEPLLNEWLRITYQLSALAESWVVPINTSSLLLNNWNNLPKVAQLAGGYLLRATLLKDVQLLVSDQQLLAFISLPLRHQVHVKQEKPMASDLVSYGAAFILSQFSSLPAALLQRFRLLFPAELTLAKLCVPVTADHLNLIRMAMNYANHYPG